MFRKSGAGRRPKGGAWRDNKARSLRDAAQLAHQLAVAERLPIQAVLCEHPERWHAERLVKTVPVYGMRNGRRTRVTQTADMRLESDLANLDGEAGAWRDLEVERADFQSYLGWLRTIW